jgi:HEAT repeat protein/energy-coupling factor transporter ATP-binding protein EcfA2
MTESLVFALLQILTRPEDGGAVVLHEGEVHWGDLRFQLAGGAPAPAKTAYLLRRLGLEGIPLERLAETWRTLLAEKHPRSPRELLAAVRREGSVAAEDEIPRRWRAAIETMLRKIPAAAGAVESFGPETPPADFALRLELQPLLETWPRRLLHHPWWATAEAPLPTMSPLPLDEVWVDLQMLDPGEWPVLAGLENLRSLLDQRYEERRWHSEPLALVLERISGAAAFIGPPGSGKTTLLKWIARHLIQESGSRYLLPLFVPLRRYALWRMNGGEPGLLRFALQECGVQRPEQKSLWVQILNEMAGTWRERILVLLDGWDEVPVEEREALLQELRDLACGFSVLVTSRPAAFPARLAASRVYEVADLAPDGIDALIRRWFRGAGEPAHAEALLLHLDRHPDLRRLARNPFLLTLLCGISRESHRRQGLDVPSSRAALYEQTMRLIYAHHAERHPEAPVNPERRRQIERLALWLLDEAPGAPRFVFGPQDVIDSGGAPDLLPQVLKPARLLGQLGTDDDTHHFLHATFQEYLAAEALEQEPGPAVHKLRAHVHDAAWQEVFHFLAAEPGPLRDAFWREMAALAARPDRFGLLAARLARWVSAAGARDGGMALLGCDLRELLWPLIERITASGIWVEAYAELDAAGFVRRVDEAIPKVDPRLRARLQRALTRIRNPAASRSLVEQILGADPHQAAVAAAQLRLRIDRAGLDRLRETAGDAQRSVAVRQQAIQALGYARDPTSVPLLLRLAGTGPDLAGEVARALGRIGGPDATAGLVALLDRSGSDLQRSAVRALGEMRDAPARDALLDEIARRPEDDPLLVPILDALAEIPIHRGAGLIVDLLASETPETRRAAAWALAEATGPGVFQGLMTVAKEDPEEEVREAALEVFESRARPDDAGWLAACIADPDRSSDEQGFALRALLTAAGRYAGTPEGQWLPGIAAEQVLLALRDPEGDLALEAVAHAHHAGPSVGPRLAEICLDEEASPGVRELACAALGKMEYRGAVDALLRLVRAAPDADDDEDQPLETGGHRIARAAAEALARIDAGLLLREPGSTTFHALARFAVETGCLVYGDHIAGPDGREWARAPSLPAPARPHTPRRSAPPRSGVSAVDLDIKVSVRMVEGSQVLRYALSSPSGAAPVTHREVQTDPFTGSFDTYRDRVIHRLEKLQDRLHPHGSYLAGEEVEPEMKRLGHELYRQLFPAEMKGMYRRWRDKVRTIQISSAEWWIPWELVRPYDQDLHPVIDDDFLGARFEVTRWLIGGTSPAAAIRIERLACVEAGESGGPRLPSAARERELLADLARHRQIEDASPAQATFSALTALLERGGLGLLHFAGHGEFSREHPEDSRILLADGRSLAAGELEGPLLQKISADRPLVFFNACSTAQQGAALTSLSGWPDAWIGRAGAGAFVAPQWQVRDSLAYELARLFYLALERGRTLGRAARLARRWVRRKDRRHATWLAFAVYGHPHARVSFGSEDEMKPAQAPPVSRGRRPGGEDLFTALDRNAGRTRKSLEPYLLPRIPRQEVDTKYLPAIRESIAQKRSRVIPILGSAGFGKSTLLGEIYDVLRSEEVAWTGLVDSAELALSSPADLPLALSRTLCDTEMPLDTLAAALSRKGPGVLLIDTLDLVLSPTVVPHLQRLLFGLGDTATTVVFTCRDVDYQLQLEPARMRLPQIVDRVDRYTVPAFTAPEVALAARAFVDASPLLRGTLAGEEFLERLRSLSTDGRSLQPITSNPLLLAMLCEVFGQAGDLPRDLTVSELYDRYWEEKIARSRTLGTGDPVLIEKPRLCLRIAQHLVKEWNELGQDWIAEPDLGIEGSAAVAQARAELLSEGILKPLAHHRVRFFHQTFLEYVMARWLATRSGAAALETILGSVWQGENEALHWWPVLRQLLVLVEPAVFAAIVDQLPLEKLVTFRTVSFATVARAEPHRWEELLHRALDLGEEFQKTLCLAAENAPARFLAETWTVLEVLLRSGARSVAVSATATVATLLAREKDSVAERLRAMLDALAARARSTPEQGQDTEILGQLLRACLPVLEATSGPEAFELLQERFPSFASKGKGLIIDLFGSAQMDESRRAQFVRFLFAQGREKHLPTESLVALVEKTLRAGMQSENLSPEERLELLYRPIPEDWVSFHARAVARLFSDDFRLVSEVAKDYFSPHARSLHSDTSLLEELVGLGQADEVCRALSALSRDTLPPGRMSSLTTLSRELSQRAGLGPRRELARWLQPLAAERPGEVLEVFASVADASDETWSELVAALWAVLERGDDRLAQRAVEGIPSRALTRLAPEVERLADRYPGRASLQHMLVAIYEPQAGTSAEAVSRLVELSLSPAKEVALAASRTLARSVGDGTRLRVAEILPLAQSKIPGVRDHLMEAVVALQKAGGSIAETELVDLCQSLAGETNDPALQKLCAVAGTWLRTEGRVIFPVMHWAVELTRRAESGLLGGGAGGALIRTLKVMAQLEDPQIAALLQEAAQRMLLGAPNPNRLSVGESEMTDLLSALARVDHEFLARLVDSGPALPERNVRALAFTIRRVEGPGSPLLSLMLNSAWCPPSARNAILEFRGV